MIRGNEGLREREGRIMKMEGGEARMGGVKAIVERGVSRHCWCAA